MYVTLDDVHGITKLCTLYLNISDYLDSKE